MNPSPRPDGAGHQGTAALPASPVVRDLLEANAVSAPAQIAVSFEDGSSWTWATALENAYSCANGLRRLGFRQGDRIGIRLPNGEEFLRLWWGAACAGLVIVPINPALRGEPLRHLLDLAEAGAVVAEPTDLELRREAAARGMGLLAPADAAGSDVRAPVLERPVAPWDAAALILTSGTTGPSKLVTVTYLYACYGGCGYTMVEGLGPDDCFLIDLPMFHMAALAYIAGSLCTRTRIALRTRPSLGRYWDVVNETGATAALLMSTLTDAVIKAPPGPSDRAHTLRSVLMSPVPADVSTFAERFGIRRILTTYGSTEVPSAFRGYATDPAAATPGYVGRPYGGYTARLVDDDDIEVGVGAIGQLVLRSVTPWVITPSYFGDEAATAAAWRNGWFHTGDLMRRDAAGDYFFVGRTKDALRRRGENISAFEVETALARHEAIAEVACVAYPSDAGVDDEVKVWLVLAGTHAEVDCEELLRHAHAHLPHYMVPRYFELTDALPKTPSLRVQKHVLRERGNGARTWDRERHGLRVTRRGIERIQV